MVLAAEDLVGVGAPGGQGLLEVLEDLVGPLLVAEELHQPDHERVAQLAELGERLGVGLGPDFGVLVLGLARVPARPGAGAGEVRVAGEGTAEAEVRVAGSATVEDAVKIEGTGTVEGEVKVEGR